MPSYVRPGIRKCAKNRALSPNAQVKGGALRVFGIACILVAAVAGHRRSSVRMFWYQ